MNKLRRLAEDLVNQNPSLFGGDFDKNKLALGQVTIIRTRSLRNQLAGAITKIIHERGPLETAVADPSSGTQENSLVHDSATLEDRVRAEGAPVPNFETEQANDGLKSDDSSSARIITSKQETINSSKPIAQ